MSRVNRWFLAAVLVVVALAVLATTVRPTARAARAARGGLAPVAAATMVCPSFSGRAGLTTSQLTVAGDSRQPTAKVGYLRLAAGGGPARGTLALRPSATLTASAPGGALAVVAAGTGAGNVAASQVALTSDGQSRGLSDIACAAPGTDWWFAGADGRIGTTDVIVIANPGDAPANLALSLWSQKGPVNSPKSDGVNVAPRSSTVLRISDLAPDLPTLALHVHANSGTVTTAVLDLRTLGVRPLGQDWMPPTAAPSTSSLVTGFMAGAHYNLLFLANPTGHDATVTLRVVTPTRNFQPAGQQTVVVPAGRTTSLNLTGTIAAEAAAVQVASDSPVLAQGLSLMNAAWPAYSDYAWLAATQPLRSPALLPANAAPFGQSVGLILTAPKGTARVRITAALGAAATITVPAGRTATVDLLRLLHAGGGGPGPVELTALTAEPVYVVRTLFASGAHGPLVTAEVPSVLPAATVLPPVVADLRAATS